MGLSWKAKKKGDVYCAPACGRGCTVAEHKLAKSRAKTLAKRMGKGWKKRVWENMGWHYSVISPCGRVKVHVNWFNSGKKDAVAKLADLVPYSYTAFLGEPGSSGGRWAEHGDTPEEAVNAVLAVAQTELSKIGAMIVGLAPCEVANA